jgi:hypothetical protein
MKKYLFTALIVSAIGVAKAQNVGVGTLTPDASAKLEIIDGNRGLLIPRVSLSAANNASPISAPANSLLVYNTSTSGAAPDNVTPGFYYWESASGRWIRLLNAESTDWKMSTTTAGTNALSAVGYLGTSTNQSMDLVTNNVVRGRLSNAGEFTFGATTTATVGDLMGAVSNASFPWAINGYSSVNGGGVYGQIVSGTTVFGGVQGEYGGTGAQGAGVRGNFLSAGVAGTAFTSVVGGVVGNAANAGAYKFGTYGSGGTSLRSGGVMGNDYGIALGSLGYYASNNTDISVYGFGRAFTTGVAGGRLGNGNSTLTYQDGSSELSENTHIGLGIYGGVMGGWVRGLKYGFHAKGETYGLYVDGQGFTNQPMAYLMPTDNEQRVPGYMAATLTPDITDKGKVELKNGRAYVAFSESFRKVMADDLNQLVITATPQGSSKGVFIDQITEGGFWIQENDRGTSNVQIAWMASSPVQTGNLTVDPEILNAGFDRKMERVMFNDNNTDGTAQPIWWDGKQMRWDTPPAKKQDTDFAGTSRGQEKK